MFKENLRRSLFTAVATAMLMPFPASAGTALPGDLNLDGKVSLSELQSVINAFLNVTPDAVPPTAPTNLSAIALSTTQIKLTWTAATDDVGVTAYKIFRGASQVGTVTGTTFTDTGLIAGSKYSYTVVAYDAFGNASPATAIATAVTEFGTATSKLVGSWYAAYPNAGRAKGPVVINFVDGQRFMMAHDGDVQADPSGTPGMESGTYTWNEGNGVFAATVTADTNGQWGFSNSGPLTLTLSTDNNTLKVNGQDFATRVLPSGTNALVGGWYRPGPGGSIAITIINDTTFMLAHDGTPDGSGWPGMESGTYTWNPATHIITTNATVDTNGDWGVNSGTGSIAVSDDNKTLIVDGVSFASRIP